jgi:hypothetical protein
VAGDSCFSRATPGARRGTQSWARCATPPERWRTTTIALAGFPAGMSSTRLTPTPRPPTPRRVAPTHRRADGPRVFLREQRSPPHGPPRRLRTSSHSSRRSSRCRSAGLRMSPSPRAASPSRTSSCSPERRHTRPRPYSPSSTSMPAYRRGHPQFPAPARAELGRHNPCASAVKEAYGVQIQTPTSLKVRASESHVVETPFQSDRTSFVTSTTRLGDVDTGCRMFPEGLLVRKP